MHPANLALRFVLELAALSGFGLLTWKSTSDGWRIVAIVIVLSSLMTLWGVFAVPNDPSRSGNAPFPVSGTVRLGLELLILAGGAAAFYWAGYTKIAAGMAVLIVLHYTLSGARIAWLLQQ